MSWVFPCLYNAFHFVCFIFALHRLMLGLKSLQAIKRDPKPLRKWKQLPKVTVQLPIYNERFVVQRLIEAVAKLDYPRELLEIQVLDDSTDDTTQIAQEVVDSMRLRGMNMKLIHRVDRKGYKAGALEEGVSKASGEFIVVFDADFVPPQDYIYQTIHYFTDSSVGMVQMRWGHENPNDSFLTRLQTIIIDGHFMVDQVARHAGGRFFNFNGSAGIWRKQAIESAGGWEGDTLCEDLDLSYRAQLKGWQFVLLTEEEVLQQLPRDMRSFKQQQFRWSKGSLEVAHKVLSRVWKSAFPLKIKLEATFHLVGNVGYAFIAVSSLLTLPVIWMHWSNDSISDLLIDLPLFVTGLGSIMLYFAISQIRLYRDWPIRLAYFPFYMAALAGLSLLHVKALWEVICRKRTAFIRTPKESTCQRSLPQAQIVYKSPFDPLTFWELFMGLYLSIAVGYAITQHLLGMIPFLTLMACGFFYVAFRSFSSFRPAASQEHLGVSV